MQAVALALEAAGISFCEVDDQGAVAHEGVQLSQDDPVLVRVVWRHRRGERPVDAGEARLGEAASVLDRAGWDALLYRARGSRYLLVEPGRDA
ncbi:hypothetical protein [Streptacidiphilus neutrinimicus]|uniref:hypothetical protein n=1 Tax=Streptacidiphilus neutrinimicus TaxID=105420 RepID=UPI001F33383A|nr:hypothetical protein [Streptacidiphilus neutrinimicus]